MSAPAAPAATTGMLIRRAVCPGSFDPVTNGHLDIVARAAGLFDKVTVLVAVNTTKTSMFTVDERLEMLREVTAEFGNVKVDAHQGLLVDFCRAHGIPVIVKGLRAVSDFDYELQMAQMNHNLAGVDTMFMSTNPEYSFLASSLVKDVAKWGGDVSALVPPSVHRRILARVAGTAPAAPAPAPVPAPAAAPAGPVPPLPPAPTPDAPVPATSSEARP